MLPIYTGFRTRPLVSSHAGFPLSTTQVTAGSILGTGLGRSGSQVRWGVAGRMVLAWLFTLPMAGLVGGVSARIANTGTFGVVGVAVVLIAASTTMYLLNRRNAVTAETVNDVELPDTRGAVATAQAGAQI